MAGIAIIEDDTLIRALMTEWLTSEGYAVLPAGSRGRAADVRLLIVDLFMPRHLGSERLRSARGEYPGVPVIAVSAQFRPGMRCGGPEARALGVDRVVAKPFDRQALLDAVRSVIGPAIVATP
jgi:DNA-binding response OmpR family regulator